LLQTELTTAEIPEIYQRFAHVVDDRHWKRRVAALKVDARGNRFLGRYLNAENSIAFALERCRILVAQHGVLLPGEVEKQDLYPAIGFAAQVLSMMDMSSPNEAERLRRRVHGALRKPDDLYALQLELSAATHFVRRGHTVVWPEMNGWGTFDLFVESIGNNGLEIECKSISDDKGRKVHRREALDFCNLLWPHLKPIKKGLAAGLSVVLTVPGRLPTEHKNRLTLAKRISQQILAGCSGKLEDGSDIRVSGFDVTSLGDVGNDGRPRTLRAVVDGVTTTQNREAMIIGTRVGGVFALVVQSMASDSFIDAVFDTLSTAAKKQVTGNRPAMLLVGFRGLSGEQLLSIADQDNNPEQQPSALRLSVSRFLSGQNRDHVVGVSFLSRSTLGSGRDGIVDSGGLAYSFPKRQSTHWHDDFNGLFSTYPQRN
jgi:hypothetical protein